MTPPVFAHGHLRLYLLALLAEQPMHGYDLIQALGERFGGTYTPSAGTIYPRLAKLEDDGLVVKSRDGRRTVYAITDTGRAELERREPELDEIENDVSDSVRRLADEVRTSVEDAMRTLKADLAAAARDARTEARAAGRTARVDVADARNESRQRLQQAEAEVNRFRADVRAELRSRGDALDAETLATLTAGLATLLGELRRPSQAGTASP
jgi:DNA-binding PadR family transcriptional regulator